MKVTFNIPDEAAQKLVERALEDPNITVGGQITKALYWYIRLCSIPKEKTVVTIERSALSRAKQYNTLEELTLDGNL